MRIDCLLKLLDRGTSPEDLRMAGVRVHRLVGDRRGFSAIEVSANLGIIFRFRDGNAHGVEVVDYHRSLGQRYGEMDTGARAGGIASQGG